jgi:hypothetical protein
VTCSFATEVTTDRPSIATFSSIISMPFSAQASISSCLAGRDASLTSVSPLQNRSKPSLVPGPVTSMATSAETSSLNISATSALMGSTVDEPDTTTAPVRPPPGAPDVPPTVPLADAPEPPQPAAARTAARARPVPRVLVLLVTRWDLLSYLRPLPGRPGRSDLLRREERCRRASTAGSHAVKPVLTRPRCRPLLAGCKARSVRAGTGVTATARRCSRGGGPHA